MNTEDLPLNGGDNDCCLTRLGWLRSRPIIRDGRLLRNYSIGLDFVEHSEVPEKVYVFIFVELGSF